MSDRLISPGIYRHYKGKFYMVIGTVVMHDTRQPFVLYIPLYLVDGDQRMTIRPQEDFLGIVDKLVRFVRVGP